MCLRLCLRLHQHLSLCLLHLRLHPQNPFPAACDELLGRRGSMPTTRRVTRRTSCAWRWLLRCVTPRFTVVMLLPSRPTVLLVALVHLRLLRRHRHRHHRRRRRQLNPT